MSLQSLRISHLAYQSVTKIAMVRAACRPNCVFEQMNDYVLLIYQATSKWLNV